ncbi:sulfite exporter TauE/SafE family protein [Ornithinimicrobium sediminis]|uniref:sulfite exporter TauE/SafE family protein n=1 Tax=Ornithinimicrobium sediminis TaxID=2904603 RepID=UPI001E35BEAC|nr:sulfite exporter TauE/SafE family protein [Ornithinimicrobium sediminis]MCE0486779.1 sulfite exporter TauE/SafE family protein [Ornithinimicrobium sediminis]
MSTLVLTLALAVLVGVTLGLLGGGGSILMVPLLVYVAGMEAKEAIATSLLVVGVTSAVGAISHARAGRVQWRTGLIFGAAGMAGAYGGGRVAEFIPGEVLLIAFALMMLATSVAMLRGRKAVDPDKVHEKLPVGKVVLEGLVVGLVTGIVGAGGGFLVVPALALLGGLPMPVAVGTSLVVIAMKSMAGLAGYLASVQIDWTTAAMVTGAAVVGALVGGLFSGKIHPDTLRKIFGWFVLVMAFFVGGREAPEAFWSLLPLWGWVAVGAAVVAAVTGLVLLRRRRSRSTVVDSPPAVTRQE